MNKIMLVLVLLPLLTLGLSHAQVSLNFREIPFQNTACNFLSPSQIQDAYGFNSLYNSGYNGAGESIAIVVAHGDSSLQSDVNEFDSQYGLPALTQGSNLIVSFPFGQPTSYSSHWTAESALDVEVAHSLAPGAKIYVVVAPNSSWLFNAVNYTINNLPVNTISLSWGSSELDYNSAGINYENSILAEGEQKGINIFAASGDSGAYNNLSTLNVNFPASSPDVIAVGGTTLSVAQSGSYEGETGWNRSGGGQSQFFPRPSYQPDLGSNRLVPDVAFNAGTPICIYENSSWGGFYGTSLAAPSWAALDSILNQKSNGDIGFLGQDLYKIYNSAGSLAFNNITSGCNGYYCADGSYNEVTGLGSPKAYPLVQLLSNADYKIYFDPSATGDTFSVDGVNYSAPTALNFTYGQKIYITAYSTQISQNKKSAFVSFSGLLSSDSPSASLFVNKSGIIYIDYNSFFGVNLIDYKGDINQTQWYQNGTTLSVDSPLYVNSSDLQYTLFGMSVDGGPVLEQASYSTAVYSPLNISFVWFETPAETVDIGGYVPGISVDAKFIAHLPLSNSTKYITESAVNGSAIFPLQRSSLYFYSVPEYIGSFRYVMKNTTLVSGQYAEIKFYKEQKYTLKIISQDNSSINSSYISVSFDGFNESFSNDTIWAPYDSEFNVTSIKFDGVDLLSGTKTLSQSVVPSAIVLPVSNINVSLSTYFGIPVIGAGVTLHVGNAYVNKSTGLSGKVTFLNIPDKEYNLTVSAYGSDYAYNSLTGQDQALILSPLLYQVYIIVGIVGVILIVLAGIEAARKKRKQRV